MNPMFSYKTSLTSCSLSTSSLDCWFPHGSPRREKSAYLTAHGSWSPKVSSWSMIERSMVSDLGSLKMAA